MKDLSKRIEELVEEIYSLNRQISLHYIAMQKQPTEKEIMHINRLLGTFIKEARAIAEELETRTEKRGVEK